GGGAAPAARVPGGPPRRAAGDRARPGGADRGEPAAGRRPAEGEPAPRRRPRLARPRSLGDRDAPRAVPDRGPPRERGRLPREARPGVPGTLSLSDRARPPAAALIAWRRRARRRPGARGPRRSRPRPR